MLCFATICGLRRRTAASVMWKRDKLRIIAAAEMIAIFAVGVDCRMFDLEFWSEKGHSSRLHVDVAWLRGRNQSKLRNAKTCCNVPVSLRLGRSSMLHDTHVVHLSNRSWVQWQKKRTMRR
jgi:hypothetical protein